MLQLSNSLVNRPVLGLRTGSQVASVVGLLINPDNLKIEGFYCEDRFEKRKDLPVLLSSDIREVIPQGFVINDHESLTDIDELVRFKRIIEIGFDPMGKQVITEDKQKVGKISDFAVEMDSMYIQKLYASQSILRSLTGGSLSIDRSQIVEITDRAIIIKPLLGDARAPQAATA